MSSPVQPKREKFTVLRGVAAPLLEANVNTDIITPMHRLVGTPRGTFGRILFEPWRYDKDGADGPDGANAGNENPDFILNRDGYRNADILICGPNFGCGSSREAAVWALQEYGIRALIAPSFGNIFFNNCFQSGLLPIRLDAETVDRLADDALKDPAMTVDLHMMAVTSSQDTVATFDIDPFRRNALMQGLDDIGMTMTRAAEIEAFQSEDRGARPWVYLDKEGT